MWWFWLTQNPFCLWFCECSIGGDTEMRLAYWCGCDPWVGYPWKSPGSWHTSLVVFWCEQLQSWLLELWHIVVQCQRWKTQFYHYSTLACWYSYTSLFHLYGFNHSNTVLLVSLFRHFESQVDLLIICIKMVGDSMFGTDLTKWWCV